MSDVILLFRAISYKEMFQIRHSGRFEVIEASAEGKYFAETLGDAFAWGERLFDSEDWCVIQASFLTQDAEVFYKWTKLDGIGPARFATVEQLADAVYSEILYYGR